MDTIEQPEHYKHYPLEVIKMIEILLNNMPDLKPYEAYCLGNEFKYRFRAGFKGDAAEDIGKAMKYKTFRDKVDSP